MVQAINEGAFSAVSQETARDETSHKKRKLLYFLILIFIVFIIIYFFFVRNNGTVPADTIQEQATGNTVSVTPSVTATPTITDKVPPCAPVYSGGTVVSHTSTNTTWSYYFSNGSSASVSAYVKELKSGGWSTISEKTIANTSFWDLKKESCTVNLRYHAPDEGVILEMKN